MYLYYSVVHGPDVNVTGTVCRHAVAELVLICIGELCVAFFVEHTYAVASAGIYGTGGLVFEHVVDYVEIVGVVVESSHSWRRNVIRMLNQFYAVPPRANPQALLAVYEQFVGRVHVVCLRILLKLAASFAQSEQAVYPCSNVYCSILVFGNRFDAVVPGIRVVVEFAVSLVVAGKAAVCANPHGSIA